MVVDTAMTMSDFDSSTASPPVSVVKIERSYRHVVMGTSDSMDSTLCQETTSSPAVVTPTSSSDIRQPPTPPSSATRLFSGVERSAAEKMTCALKWLTAIQEATQCLHSRDLHSVFRTEHSLLYLMKLESLLAPLEKMFNSAPPMDPPEFTPYQIPKSNLGSQAKKKGGKGGRLNKAEEGQATTSHRQSPTSVVEEKKSSSNRFALFQDDSEDETEDDDKRTIKEASRNLSLHQGYDELLGAGDVLEAGDVPTLNRVAHFPAGTAMVMRRLMIRIVTAQSELFAYQANGHRRCQAWTLGAESCHAGLFKMHQGLLLADGEISRCLATGLDLDQRQLLMEDANIVDVAVKSLTKEKDSFVQKALAKKHKLERQLEEHYIKRSQALRRVGEKKWKQNPKPRNKGVFERNRSEDQLCEIENALDHLIQLDTFILQECADHLKFRLQAPPTKPKYSDRYIREHPVDFSHRVDSVDYPDPTSFGWVHTGSGCSVTGEGIEYFEKQGILLDWYFESARVELAWKHNSRDGYLPFYQSGGPVSASFYNKVISSAKPWEVVKPKKCNSTKRGSRKTHAKAF